MGSRKETCYDSGKRAAHELWEAVSVKSCVDQYVQVGHERVLLCFFSYCRRGLNFQDQLIVFMALAKGRSRVRCTQPLTLHTKTAIHITEMITNVKFNITEEEHTSVIECNGIGLENKYL